MVDLDAPYSKEMYMLAGGNFSISGSTVLTGDVIRGPWKSGMMVEFVFSIYAGTMKAGGLLGSKWACDSHWDADRVQHGCPCSDGK